MHENDTSELRRAEHREQRLRAFVEMVDAAPNAVTIHDEDGRFLYANQKTFMLHGYTPDEFLAINLRDLDVPESAALIDERIRLIMDKGEATFETSHYRKDGSILPLEVTVKVIQWEGRRCFLSVGRDITERRQAEAERARLEAQLHQAMKMEAIGRLAGGIAHDFNNLLTGISGNVELARLDLRPDDPMRETLQEIANAAASAAELVRQLLAFSRRQLVEERVLDVNEVVESLRPMLERLIGEDIELRVLATAESGSVRVGAGQLEQVIVNLVVNARDAMPEGGVLRVETANVELDEDFCGARPEAQAGPYVRLVVSDTGEGMSEEVQQHLFEPFFTTKRLGRGMGLGLATLYGAVRQAGGFVEVSSVLGRGSRFELYLPRVSESLARPRGEANSLPGGRETVLLVEDEKVVRDVADRILRRLGYTVLQAPEGASAVRLAEEYLEPIHLLMTDVVMPGLNGRQLANRLSCIHPEMKVLYTSGYTENAIARHGVIEPGLHFIGKPYSVKALARKLREILD